MAAPTRPHFRQAIVRKVSGAPADGTVRVNVNRTGTLYAGPIYQGPEGAATYPNPVPFSGGTIDFYLSEPERLRLVITPIGGDAQVYDDVDVYEDADTSDAVVLVIPHTFVIAGDVRVASGEQYVVPPFFLPNIPGQKCRLVGMCYVLRAGGTVNFSIVEDGAAIGSAWTKTASTTETEVMQDTGDFPTTPPRSSIGLIVNSITGTPKNMTVTLYMKYTVA